MSEDVVEKAGRRENSGECGEGKIDSRYPYWGPIILIEVTEEDPLYL